MAEKENYADEEATPVDPSNRLRRREIEIRELIVKWRRESPHPFALSWTQQRMIAQKIVNAVVELGESVLTELARKAGPESEFQKNANRLAHTDFPTRAVELWCDVTATVELEIMPIPGEQRLVEQALWGTGFLAATTSKWHSEVACGRVRKMARDEIVHIAEKIIIEWLKTIADMAIARSETHENETSREQGLSSPLISDSTTANSREERLREFSSANPGSSSEFEVAPERSDRTTARAEARQAVVMPILKNKRWTPGKWATMAGVGKNSVYEYLNGRRKKISDKNRVPMAEVLGLKPEKLPG